MHPAVNEEIRMMNLALLMIWWSSNANKVTKIDMVKPIPPKNPMLIIFFQFKSEGNLHSPTETAKKLNREIPIGFPNTKPSIIPIL